MITNLILPMAQTFGSSAIIMSPLFDLFLFALAVLLIIAFFNYTQPNSFFRNLLAGYGLFEVLRNGFNYLCAPNQNQHPYIHHHQSPRIIPHIHTHGMFHPHQNTTFHNHPSNGRTITGHGHSPIHQPNIHGHSPNNRSNIHGHL